MNYCPNCGYRFPGGYHPPVQPYTPYTPYPTYPYWFSTAGSGGGEGISVTHKGGTANGPQRSPQN